MLYAFGCLLFGMSFAAMISTDPLCSPPVCQAPPRQRRRRRQCWDAMVSQLLGEPFIHGGTITPTFDPTSGVENTSKTPRSTLCGGSKTSFSLCD